jgi:F-type H+-transporting ATPase subunit b
MDATLQALGGILLKAIPTLILLVVVHLYLKSMFFRPLEEVLAKRRAMTEGARESAEALLQRASEKTAEYEAKLREARGEIYREQEEMRRRWVDDQTKRIEEARLQTRELIRQAKEQIEAETVSAKRELAVSSDALADQIAHSLLARRAG